MIAGRLQNVELSTLLGRGGSSVVFGGRQLGTDALVAVKVLVGDHARRAEYRVDLMREAHALARLDHPGIAALVDLGFVEPSAAARLELPARAPYLVMEWVQGPTLGQCELPETWARARALLLQMLDALAHAHALGVIHRDLKPSNVIVSDAGTDPALSLVDFGIALPAEDLYRPDDGGSDVIVAGTPAYMAPEQIRGATREQGPWTDLYALGCLAWKLVTGSEPHGKRGNEALVGHLAGVLPPFEPRFAVPLELLGWLERLLAKEPLARFAFAADASAALAAWSDPGGRAISAPRVGTPDTTTLTTPAFAVPDVGEGRAPPVRPPLIRHAIGREPPRDRPVRRRTGLGALGLRRLPLVNRESERARLWHRVRIALEERSPQVVLLHGQPGCGKTRLADWVAQHAHERGLAHVLRAPHDALGAPTDGVASMIATFFQTVGLPRALALERIHLHLRWLGFEEATVLDTALALTEIVSPLPDDAPDTPRVPALRFRSARERARAALPVIEALAERGVILWLEDAEWARDSLELIQELLRDGTRGWLAVLTVNDPDCTPEQRQALRDLVGKSGGDEIEVGPLPAAAELELVRDTLGLEASLAAHVVERSQGVPLFALQLIDDWVARHALSATGAGYVLALDAVVPEDVESVWQGRVDQVLEGSGRQEARWAIEIAAALGTKVDRREWRAVCETRGVAIDELQAELDRGALTIPTERGFAFVHATLRAFLERTARGSGRASEHHRACERMLATLYPDQGAHGLAHRRYRHLIAAGDLDAALGPLLAALQQSRKLGDYDECRRILADAGAAVEALGLAAGDARRIEMDWVRADLLDLSGDAVRAAALIARVVSAARGHVDARLLGECLATQGDITLRMASHDVARDSYLAAIAELSRGGGWDALTRTWLNLGMVYEDLGQPDEADRTLLEMRAVLATQQVSPGLRVRAMLRGAMFTLAKEGPEPCARQAEEAMSVGAAAGDRMAQALALSVRAEALHFAGQCAGAAELYQREVELRQRLGDRSDTPRMNLAFSWVGAGERERAEPVLSALRERLTAIGRKRQLPLIELAFALCSAQRADWARCDEHLGRAGVQMRELGLWHRDCAWFAEAIAAASQAGGETERAVSTLELAIDHYVHIGYTWSEARARAALGAIAR